MEKTETGKGKVLLIIGRNGTGKSTLLRLIHAIGGKRASYYEEAGGGKFHISKAQREEAILFDEPFARLDEEASRKLAKELAESAKRVSVVVATHKEDAPSFFPKETDLRVIRLALQGGKR